MDDFPEQPAGMTLHIQRSPGTVRLVSVYTISAARNKEEKFGWIFLGVPFCFLLAAGWLDALVRLIFFHASVELPSGYLLPHWAALTIFVPVLAVIVLVCAFLGRLLFVSASQFTTEREDWSLQLRENWWHVSFDERIHHTNRLSQLDETYGLNPSNITKLGIEDGKFGDKEGGRVYCIEVIKSRPLHHRVDLTPMLSKAEAAWMEHALRSVLNRNPGSQ